MYKKMRAFSLYDLYVDIVIRAMAVYLPEMYGKSAFVRCKKPFHVPRMFTATRAGSKKHIDDDDHYHSRVMR